MICVSWPIPYKNPLRKLFFNTGFQFNYGEPFSLSSFYNATYFQNNFDGRHRSDNNVLFSGISSIKDKKHKATNFNGTQPNIDDKQNRHFVERSGDSEENNIIGSDLTAAQLYESIENSIKE